MVYAARARKMLSQFSLSLFALVIRSAATPAMSQCNVWDRYPDVATHTTSSGSEHGSIHGSIFPKNLQAYGTLPTTQKKRELPSLSGSGESVKKHNRKKELHKRSKKICQTCTRPNTHLQKRALVDSASCMQTCVHPAHTSSCHHCIPATSVQQLSDCCGCTKHSGAWGQTRCELQRK